MAAKFCLHSGRDQRNIMNDAQSIPIFATLKKPSERPPATASPLASIKVGIRIATVICITLWVKVIVVIIDAWYIRDRASLYGTAVIDAKYVVVWNNIGSK